MSQQKDLTELTVEDAFRDYKGRREGLIKALTSEFDAFHRLCDPARDNLCLYGLPNGSWDVGLPEEDVPTKLPEPVLGINYHRDEVDTKEWLTFIAVHSEAWLLRVAFYHGINYRFSKEARDRLFQMINDLPTLSEVVFGVGRKPTKAKAPKSSTKSKKSGSKVKPTRQSKRVSLARAPSEEHEDREGEGCESTSCSSCGVCLGVRCDDCGRWFHVECVKITSKIAERIKKFECSFCAGNMRLRI